MRRLAYALVVIVPATLQCNAIIGVEDVKLVASKNVKRKDGGDEPPTGDDDDSADPRPTGSDPPGTTPGAGSACDGKVDCKRTVFVTRATYNGNLGGVAGADKKCNDAAKAVSKLSGKNFKAWLSDTTSQARSRLPQGTDSYVLVDGSIVASSFVDLSDGSLGAAIALDEKGQALDSSDSGVWTGSAADGTVTQFTCSNWTSQIGTDPFNDSGETGDATKKTLEWSEGTQTSCNGMRHLYCLEF